jgi:lambda repressor-like predicted transcriptional regulator
MTDRRRVPRTMSDQERVEIIFSLRKKRWTYARIGKLVGLSANGVKYALHRVTQPGRHADDAPEEVD